MKVVCQVGLLPGGTPREKLDAAQRFGFDAVELDGGELNDPAAFQVWRQALRGHHMTATTICGGIGNTFVSIEPSQRRQSMDELRRHQEMAAELGALGQVFTPIFRGENRMPDLRPYKSRYDLCRDLLRDLLPEIDAMAGRAGVTAFMEPLNRYESDVLNRLEQATALLEEVGARHTRVTADFFHMHLEETNTAAAIRQAGKWIGHVHLADGTRRQPGSAGIDFTAGFAALRGVGFGGPMALECGLTGPAEDVLGPCVAYLRKCLGTSGGGA